MAVLDKDIKLLFGKAGGRCSICRSQIIVSPHPDVPESLIGEVCHMVAQSKKGPRRNYPNFDFSRVDKYENLILLCKHDHKIVDDNPGLYSVENLVKLKQKHEEWIDKELSRTEFWDCDLAQFSYINVPRLSIMAALKGYTLSTPLNLAPGQSLHSLGWNLNYVMAAFQNLFNAFQPEVLPYEKLRWGDERMRGHIFSFTDTFRTKNMPYPDRQRTYEERVISNTAKDPHIYRKKNNWKLILFIDPRWVTTSTAYGEFIPPGGSNSFSGLFMIKSVSERNKEMFGTPLILGIPKTPWDDLF